MTWIYITMWRTNMRVSSIRIWKPLGNKIIPVTNLIVCLNAIPSEAIHSIILLGQGHLPLFTCTQLSKWKFNLRSKNIADNSVWNSNSPDIIGCTVFTQFHDHIWSRMGTERPPSWVMHDIYSSNILLSLENRFSWL